jgi:hypothetical protein
MSWTILKRGPNHFTVPCSVAYAGVVDFCFHGNKLFHEKIYADGELAGVVKELEQGAMHVVINPKPMHFWRS